MKNFLVPILLFVSTHLSFAESMKVKGLLSCIAISNSQDSDEHSTVFEGFIKGDMTFMADGSFRFIGNKLDKFHANVQHDKETCPKVFYRYQGQVWNDFWDRHQDSYSSHKKDTNGFLIKFTDKRSFIHCATGSSFQEYGSTKIKEEILRNGILSGFSYDEHLEDILDDSKWASHQVPKRECLTFDLK